MYRDSDVFQLLSEQIIINHNTQQSPKQPDIEPGNSKQKCILCILKPDSALCQCQQQNNHQNQDEKQCIKTKLRSSIGNLQLCIIQLESQNSNLAKQLQNARIDIGYLSIEGIKHAKTIMELEKQLQQKQILQKKVEKLEKKLETEERNIIIIQQLKQQLQEKQKLYKQKIVQLQSKLELNAKKQQQNSSLENNENSTKQFKDILDGKQTKIDELTKQIQQMKQQFELKMKQQKQALQLQIQQMKLSIQTLKRSKSDQFIKQITSSKSSPRKYRNGIILQQDMAGADIIESLIRLQQQNYKQQPIQKSIQRHLLNFVVDYQTSNKIQKPEQLESALQIEKVRIKKFVKHFNVMTKQHQLTPK